MSDTKNPPNSAQNSYVVELIKLHQSNISSQNNLWGIFIIATVASAGFVLTAQEDVGTVSRIAMSIGFLAFAIGHGYLLYKTRRIFVVIEKQLKMFKDHPLQCILKIMSDGESTIILPFIPHVVIDIGVLVIIWSKHLNIL